VICDSLCVVVVVVILQELCCIVLSLCLCLCSVLNQQFLYDEIAAETNLSFDQLVFLLAERVFIHYKNQASYMLFDWGLKDELVGIQRVWSHRIEGRKNNNNNNNNEKSRRGGGGQSVCLDGNCVVVVVFNNVVVLFVHVLPSQGVPQMDNIHRYAHLMSQRTLMLSGRPVDMHLLLSQQISNFFRLNLDEVLLKFEASVRVFAWSWCLDVDVLLNWTSVDFGLILVGFVPPRRICVH
jgi:hypothetical protein